MKKIVFAIKGNKELANRISDDLNIEKGEADFHQFPDGETYVRVLNNVSGKEIIIVSTLNEPDPKFLPLYFLSRTLKDLGATRLILVAPYLSYMRQDKRFIPGEAVTSQYFAELISSFIDELITVEPHLHRRNSLSEIYSIPTTVIHAAQAISDYINKNVKHALLIGPDSESEQWVAQIAAITNSKFITLKKERFGDKQVKIKVPLIEEYKDYTPVLIDDIISTAHTMAEACKALRESGMKPAICIGVHAVFTDNSLEELKVAGVKQIITCNTISHKSNRIDIYKEIVAYLAGKFPF